jgi:hypothetical protein
MASRHLRRRCEPFGLQRARRVKPVVAVLTTVARINRGEPGHGSQVSGAREPRGRVLALQPAETSFKALEVRFTYDLVAAGTG